MRFDMLSGLSFSSFRGHLRLTLFAALLAVAATPHALAGQAIPQATAVITRLPSQSGAGAIPPKTAARQTAFTPAATGPTVTLTVTALGGGAITSAPLGTPVRLTATVSPAVTGIVNFCDTRYALCAGPGLLGSGSVQTAGTVTMPVVLPTGPHSIRAVYVANTAHAAGTSAMASLTVGNISVASLSSTGSAGNYSLTSTMSFFGQASATPQPTGNILIQDASNANYPLASGALGTVTAASDSVHTDSGALPLSDPVGAVTADFNEDGFPDTAIIENNGPTLSIVLGADAGPTPGMTWTAAGFPAPTAVAAGDFDGDGHIDLVVVAQNIMVYLKGDGTGSFGPIAQVNFPTAANISAVAVADMNADGILDLVALDSATGRVFVYLAPGTGSAPVLLAATVSVGVAPGSLAVGDLNGDGLPDIAVSNYGSNSFSVLLNTGSGFVTATYPLDGTPGPLVLGDFRSVGYPDLAIAVNDGSQFPVQVYANDGTGAGTYEIGLATPGGEAVAAAPLILTDGNNDGIPDLTFLGAANDLITWAGPGSGTWSGSAAAAAVSNAVMLAPGIVPDLQSSGVLLVSTAGEVGTQAQVNGWTQTNTFSGISVVGTGPHTVLPNYAGDSSFVFLGYGLNPASLTAQPLPSDTAVTANPSTSTYGQQVNLTASVTAAGGANTQGHTAGGTVTFTTTGKSYGPYAVTNGVASAQVTDLPAGADTIVATYSGDADFNASSAGASQQVNSAAAMLSLYVIPAQTTPGTQFTQLTATGVFTGSSYPTAPFFFQVDGGPVIPAGCTSWGPAGICQVNYPTASLAAGNHTIAVTYGGDSSYQAAAVSGSLLVLDGSTSLTIGVPYVNGTVGQSTAALTANVHVPAQVPGTASQVYFQVDGGTEVIASCYLTGPNDATCSATYPSASLSLGYHSVGFVVPSDGYYIRSAGGNVMLLKTP